MVFQKKALPVALVLAGLTAFPTLAEQQIPLPSVNIYGRLHATVQGADDRGTDGTESEVKSTTSRIGVKGDYKLPDTSSHLKLTYKFEWQVDISSQDNSSDDNIKSRNQYLGLAGDFGEVRVGRHDTAMKMSQGGVDQFNDLEGDLKYIFQGENRLGNTVSYLTPDLNGLSAGFTLVSEDNSEQIDDDGDSVTGISSALMYGDAKLKKMPFYGAVAYDSKVAGYDVLRVTGQAKLGGLKIGAMYQNQEQVEWNETLGARVDRDDYDGYLVSLAYALNDRYTLKAQYQKGEVSDDVEPSMVSVGIDYKLAKPAKLYVFYSHGDLDRDAVNDGGDTIDNEDWFGAGLMLNF